MYFHKKDCSRKVYVIDDDLYISHFLNTVFIYFLFFCIKQLLFFCINFVIISDDIQLSKMLTIMDFHFSFNLELHFLFLFIFRLFYCN